MDLASLQRAFQAHVTAGDMRVASSVAVSGRSTTAQRLHAYKHAYRQRLTEVLRNDYPAVAALLGAEQFQLLAHDYIRNHPSTNASLRWFGAQLPTLLSARSDATAHPEFADMATFEWQWSACFDAANAEPCSIDDLARLPAEAWLDLRLRFLPGLRRADLRSNVPAWWQAHSLDGPLPGIERSESRDAWLLWRTGLVVSWRRLDEDETVMLDAALAGEPFPELCERLFACTTDAEAVPARAAVLIKRWLAEGLVAELQAEPSET